MPSCARISRSSAFHDLGVVVFFVVVADQMQKAVDREMAEMMIERLLLVVGLPARRLDRRWRCRRACAAHRRARAGPVGCKAGNDSTLVGLSMPRQLLFSVRMPASSVSMIASSVVVRVVGIDHLGRGLDGAMDDGFGVGLGLPAVGDDENLGHGKGKGRHRSGISLRRDSLPARARRKILASRLAGCRPLRQSFIGGDDPRHQFVADDVLGGEFHLGDALDAVEQSGGFRQTRGLAVRQVDLDWDRR